MIHDAETPDGQAAASKHFDICICGAGPAGITLALKLAASGLEVALLEGGGLDYSDQSQELYKGENGGFDYFDLDIVRVRQFGGSSNHWGGWVRGLDADDFSKRDHVPMSGWPIDKADLDPFAKEARNILGVRGAEMLGNPGYPFGHPSSHMEPVQFSITEAVRFGDQYIQKIKAAANIHLFIHCNVLDLTLASDLKSADHVICAAYQNPATFKITAQTFTLAMGGLENPRFLLNARNQIQSGIGNQHDLVGRYFAEHPDVWTGFYFVRPNLSAYQGPTFLVPHASWTKERQSLRYCLAIGPQEQGSAWSMGALRSRLEQWACTSELSLSVLHMLRSGMKAGQALCVDDMEAFEGLPGAGQLRIFTEQAPNPDSRLKLAEGRDRFGLQKARLEWNLNDLDFHTMREAVKGFGETLAEADTGRVRMANWLQQNPPAFPSIRTDRVAHHHHIGTTRMADDPKSGVVDRNCRIFGISNLYIAGSSCFPTGGYANPTFTIIQLTLRLCEHLKVQLNTKP